MKSEAEIRKEIQIANFKYIKGMKLTMDFDERDDGVYLIEKDDNGTSYELARIER